MKMTSSSRDLIVLIILNFLGYGLVTGLGLFEWLEQLPYHTESGVPIEDKLYFGFALVGVSCAIFAWRRWRDLGREIARSEQTQAALAESEARFRQIMEHLEDGVYLSDLNGPNLYVNSAYERFTGRSIDSLNEQRLSWTDWIHPDDYPQILEATANFTDTFDEEYRVILPDGSTGWVRDRSFGIRGETGQVYRYCGIIQDVTARKQMEETLREREQFIQSIVSAMPNLIFIYNLAEQRLVFSNHSVAKGLGYDGVEEQILDPQSLPNYLHPEDVERYQAHLDELQMGQPGEILVIEYRLREKDGNWRWFQSNETVFKRDKVGQTLEVLGIVREVTARKEREAILRQERAYLRQVIDAVPGFIGVKNRDGRFILANQALAAAYKTTVEKVVGKTDLDFNPNRNEIASFLANDQAALDSGQVQFIPEEPVTCADGQVHWYSTYKIPLFDLQGQASQILFVSTEITERKQMEAALQRLNDELEDRVQQRTAELSQTNEQLSQEILERQRAEQALQERVDMEKLFAMLSTRFINLTAAEIDGEINLALEAVAKFALVDRINVFLLADDQQTVSLTHEWCAAGIEPRLGHLPSQPVNLLPNWLEKFERGEIIYVPRIAGLPDESTAEKELLQSYGIQSTVFLPLLYQNRGIGLLNFYWIKSEKMWSEEDLTLLQMFGEILVNALERRRADAEMQRRNRELAMLNQIIDASVSARDPEGMLTMACQQLVGIFKLVQAQAVLFDEAKTEATVIAEIFSGAGQSRLKQVLRVNEVPLLQQILAQKLPLTPDSSGFTWDQFELSDLLDAAQVESGMILPLGMNGDIVGVLSLGAARPQTFSMQDFGLLWSVADQISVVLTRMHLAQNQQRLAAVIEQITEGVMVTNPAGNIVYVNPAFERMTGYSQSEVLGQNPRLFKSGKMAPDVYAELWSTLIAGQSWRGRLTNRKKDGSFYTCDMTIAPVFDEYDEIVNFVAIKRDVSQTLQLEEQYRQAQKMESVGRLASGVAHDFNNILTAIIGYTGLSIRALPEDSPIRANLQGVEASAERAANLTRQLLAFARKQVIEPRPVNLNDLISGISKILRRLVSENIELVILPAADLGWVKADPGQLEQVLFNLVVNAHDAMPKGGKLILKTANVTLTEAEAQCCIGVTPGDYTLLSVTDTGIGMDDEVKAHLFEPFFTTKAPGKGTGLGLATCFGIVKQSDGHIWVESEPGKGTTFKVFLPRSVEAASLAPARNGTTALPRGTETILLVEDEPLARDTAARNLRGLGYTVVEAENGEEALRKMDKLGREKVQLLITDMVMPQMSGKALVEVLKPAQPDLKILFMSGYTDEVISQPYLREIGAIFLQKPFSPALLAYKVRKLLDRGYV